jgi:CubicO group peptidase (beta-lactamase class C family)
MFRFLGLIIALTILSPGSAWAQTEEQTPTWKLQKRLAELCRERTIPALWAGKYTLTGEPTTAVAGIRKWGQLDDLASMDDPVHLGSCTKAMTAVLIAQLCSEGKLRFDSPLREIFADVPAVADSSWSDVTVQELLQHRSGFPANALYHGYDAQHSTDVVASRRSLLLAVCKPKRPKKPSFVYSNIGYILLGHVVETIEGGKWEDIIARRLFERLGMQSCGFGPVSKPDKADRVSDHGMEHRPWGHTESGGLGALIARAILKERKPSLDSYQIDNARVLGPAGRAHMPMSEWSKFVLAFAHPNGHDLLGITSEVKQELLTPIEQKDFGAYAGGWIPFNRPLFGSGALYHNGSNTTWYCYAVVAPERKTCILVAANVYSTAAEKTCDEIAKELMASSDSKE